MESKIRNRILLLGLFISVLALVLILLINYKRTTKAANNVAWILTKNSAKENAEKIDFFFLRHKDVLLTTAQSLEHELITHTKNSFDIEQLLKKISKEYDTVYQQYSKKPFTGIYASVDGKLLHGIKKPDDLPENYDPTKRPWYKEGFEGNGNVVFGEPYEDIYVKGTYVMTATKLLSDKKTVIAMDITMEDLQNLSGNMELSINLDESTSSTNFGYGFVITDKGQVVAHSDISQQGQIYSDNKNKNFELFKDIKVCQEKGKVFFTKEIDGIECYVFPVKLENGWYVVTVTNTSEIRKSYSSFFIFTIISTIIVLFLILAYAVFITCSELKSEQLTTKLSNALTLAKKDVLTGHLNRTAYDLKKAELAEKLGKEDDEPFAIIMMDLNDLKYVNDNYGHVVGDEYIKNSCKLVHKIISTEIYRIGGDEFAMFLTSKDFINREQLFSELEKSLEEGNMSLVPNVEKPSIAIGMSVHIVNEDDDMDMLLHRADTQMYTNKALIKQTRLKNRQSK